MLYIPTPGWLDSMSHLAFPSTVLSGILPNPYVLSLFSECSLYDPALAETCPFSQGHYFPYCILDDRWELALELFFLVLSTLLSRVASLPSCKRPEPLKFPLSKHTAPPLIATISPSTVIISADYTSHPAWVFCTLVSVLSSPQSLSHYSSPPNPMVEPAPC